MVGPGAAFEEERLPWLEAVDNEDGPRALSARRMLAALVMVLAAAAIVAGTFFWLGRREAPVTGAPELIRAEKGPYKVRPDDPGGLDVTGESGTAYATSAGVDQDAALATDAPSPTPTVAPTPPAAPDTPAPAPKSSPAAPTATPTPTPAPAGGSTVQLGAYASTVKADTAWAMLSSRFPAVASLSKQVVTAQVGGKTLYRLRASGSAADAKAACAALIAAGESCLVVN